MHSNDNKDKYTAISLEEDCQIDENCPTPAAHRRLNDAHRLWHQTASQYGDPDGFRINLNACIEALRSVTFVLQKEKRKIPKFDEWYKGWQDKLREDSILKWLVFARNLIVKEGDLKLHSIVRVSLLKSYFEPPYKDFTVDPLTPISKILKQFNISDLSVSLKKDGILRIERRWVDSNLPSHELLDALSHSYTMLSNIIDDVHKYVGKSRSKLFKDTSDGELIEIKSNKDHLKGRLPCMIATEWNRTQWLKLSTGEFLYPQTYDVDKIPYDVIQKRYNLPDQPERNSEKPKDLLGLAEALFEYAKNILRKDGFHSTIVFLILPNGKTVIHQLLPEDRSEKYILWSKVASEVERIGAKSIVAISEAWTAPFDPNTPDRPSAESPDRLEALDLVAASSKGEEFSINCIFHRRNGEIEFEPTKISSDGTHYFLSPIKTIWLNQKFRDIKQYHKKYEIGRNVTCPCKSGKKFKKCCIEPLKNKMYESAQDLFAKGDFQQAIIAFRSWLTQYTIWYHEHTLPLLKAEPDEAEEILDIDIKAVVSICFSIVKCLDKLSRSYEINIFLDRCLEIIDDKNFRLEIKRIKKVIKTSDQ